MEVGWHVRAGHDADEWATLKRRRRAGAVGGTWRPRQQDVCDIRASHYLVVMANGLRCWNDCGGKGRGVRTEWCGLLWGGVGLVRNKGIAERGGGSVWWNETGRS